MEERGAIVQRGAKPLGAAVSRLQPRPQNLVIATNLPVDSTWSEKWKSGSGDPPRGYAFAAIELPGHRFLLTYSLHLKSNIGAPAMNLLKRQEAGRQLFGHTEEMQKLYGLRGACGHLVGGDMNTSLDDPRFEKEQTLRALIAAGLQWTFTGVPSQPTSPFPRKAPIPTIASITFSPRPGQTGGSGETLSRPQRPQPRRAGPRSLQGGLQAPT